MVKVTGVNGKCRSSWGPTGLRHVTTECQKTGNVRYNITTNSRLFLRHKHLFA